ncbi:amidase [Hydrocarboniclastica marina]|uniref:Amidase n=2 Tax=Hydrocarboniclastica marina TaxID=2259620 RepID=A0A4P7XJG7_9ALTE|nr:amidase [Hydrocarboniclastica marina]
MGSGHGGETEAGLACEARTLCRSIAKGELSPVTAMKQTLARLAVTEPRLNAFSAMDPDLAMDQARSVERQLASDGPSGPLAGLPVSVKDVLPVAGLPLRFGSRTTADERMHEDAVLVQRLRGAGACIVGKTTTSEYGAKAVGDCPLTGITRNPWNLERTPGGSSAGAGASVAAGVTAVAIGTDGAGSVRIPAALNSLFGIKPQFGRIPFYPLAAADNLVHPGIISRTVRDAAFILENLAGFDRHDPNSLRQPVPALVSACDQPLKGMRVAWSPTLGYARPDPEVLALCERAIASFGALGVKATTVRKVMADPVDIWALEFYGALAKALRKPLREMPEMLDPSLLPMLEWAVSRSAADYQRSLGRRKHLRERMRSFFRDFDLLLTPTLPVAAFEVGQDQPPGWANTNPMAWVSYTYPFNLTGQPAASIPCGFTGEGLPVGLQLVARDHDEPTLFRAAAAFEAAQPWSDILPAGFR